MGVGIRKLCDPALFNLEDAIEQAKDSAREVPGFEFHIFTFLQNLCQARHVSLPTVFRGLDILGGMLRGGIPGNPEMHEERLITMLRTFLNMSDPQIASKCVLAIGGQCRNMAWVRDVMSESDDRMRANLIESLWKRTEPDVQAILRNAVTDPHPRVAANAVYGLYLLGNDAWIPGLERLTGNDQAAFRKAGIWMLKSSSIPDAPARLKLLIRDADTDVRRAAFDALIHLREARQKGPAAPVAADVATLPDSTKVS
jgi:hypothetical protein